MKYFLGDNVNAIEIQIWVTMIAYLLLRVMQAKAKSKLAFSSIVMLTRVTLGAYIDLQAKAKSKLAFSSIVMLTRVTLGAYIDLITLLNCPKLDWNLLEQQRARWEACQNTRQLELFPK